jgi:hypothetical protein
MTKWELDGDEMERASKKESFPIEKLLMLMNITVVSSPPSDFPQLALSRDSKA